MSHLDRLLAFLKSLSELSSAASAADLDAADDDSADAFANAATDDANDVGYFGGAVFPVAFGACIAPDGAAEPTETTAEPTEEPTAEPTAEAYEECFNFSSDNTAAMGIDLDMRGCGCPDEDEDEGCDEEEEEGFEDDLASDVVEEEGLLEDEEDGLEDADDDLAESFAAAVEEVVVIGSFPGTPLFLPLTNSTFVLFFAFSASLSRRNFCCFSPSLS